MSVDPLTILLADDDEDDRELARDAFEEAGIARNLIRFVVDGEELMAYLLRQGRFAGANLAPRPGLILLDLNMPKMGGHGALRAIKSDPALRHIPVLVFSTSNARAEVLASYDLGANSHICKPSTFAKMVDAVRDIGRYWMEIVDLPDLEAAPAK